QLPSSRATGQYHFVDCSSGLTLTGKGTLSNQSGTIKLTDHESGWSISAGVNPGQHTGTAVIEIVVAAGVTQTITINDTNPGSTCGCS
ncbi:MAG TPA: hypothetical protein VI756_01425, partial [Blastocatellia bacterium]